MWNYDKLFAIGNIVGIKDTYKNVCHCCSIDEDNQPDYDRYRNNKLKVYASCVFGIPNSYSTDFEIQYIIRLDEHGNVVEKLFNRKTDMSKPMPELEDGMFGKIGTFDWDEGGNIEYLYIEDFIVTNNRVLFIQHGEIGSWGLIEDLVDSTPNNKYALCDEDISTPIEIYKNVKYLTDDSDTFEVIWRHPEYQKYLDSKYK